MSEDPKQRSDASGSGSPDPASLFADFVARREERGGEASTADFEAFVAGHPEHEAELRELKRRDDALEAELKAAMPGGDGFSFFRHPRGGLLGRLGASTGTDAGLGAKVREPGDRIGDFRLVQLLGSGGMGEVWEAEEVSLRRRVALKLVRPERVNEKTLTLFAREARAGGKLAHPGIIGVHSYGETDGVHWINQELVEGGWTLRDFIEEMRRKESLPEDYYQRAAGLLVQLAKAFQAAHDAGVIHRDIKPQNILIAPDETPKVGDFGLARIEGETALTMTGDFAGTYLYMSPEQVAARRMGLDHRSDIFSLGIVAYELLGLQRPFEGDTTHQIAEKILTWDPPELHKQRSRIPADLSVITGKMLEKRPQDRYQTMGEVAADIERHLADEPILAKPPGVVMRAVKWCKRHPVKSVIAVALLIGLPSIGGLGNWFVQHRKEVREQQRLAAIKRSEDIAERGYLELYEQQKPRRAQTTFAEARAIHPGMTANAVAGEALAVAQTDGAEAGIKVLHQSAEWAETPDLVRVEAAILETSGNPEQAASLLEDAGPPVSAVGWSLEGMRLLALGEALHNQPAQEAFHQAEDAFHRAILLRGVARMQDYFGMAHAMGHEEDAARWLDFTAQALGELWPASARAAYWRGFALDGATKGPHRSDLQEVQAIASYREAIRLDPEDAVAHDNLGLLLKDTNHPEEAEHQYREAIRLDPDDASNHNNLGLLLAETNHTEEAEHQYREAIQLDPDSARAHNNLGNLLAETNHTEEAEREYREAIRLDPDDADTRSNLGALLANTNHPEEAEHQFREAIRLDPEDAAAHYNLGRLLADTNHTEEAEQEYREAIRLDPEDAATHYNLGVLISGTNRLKDAEQEYRETIRLDPGIAEAHNALAFILLTTDRPEEALEEFRLANSLGSQRPDWPYPSAKWVQMAERAVAAKKDLPALLADPSSIEDWSMAFTLARTAWNQGNVTGAHTLEARGYELAEAAEVEIDSTLGMWTGASPNELNAAAWPLIDPAPTNSDSDIALALRLARAAVAAAPEDGGIADTLAWALFANALYDKALAEEQRAAGLFRGAELAGSLADMRARVEALQAKENRE